MDVLRLGVKCYSRAAQLDPENAGIWHNIGFNYLAQAAEMQRKGDDEDADSLRQRALNAMKRSLSLEPKSHTHWNAMGVVAIRSGEAYFGLAQHSFIKSIECENNSVAWTNLGVLYLVMR